MSPAGRIGNGDGDNGATSMSTTTVDGNDHSDGATAINTKTADQQFTRRRKEGNHHGENEETETTASKARR